MNVAGAGIETWRGGVNPWQCDQMGHMNVRFYVAHAMEALAGLAASLGMPRAFDPHGVSTLIVREHHMRFLKEARAGDALHMTVGVLDLTECEARVLQTMHHSPSGEATAVFHTRLEHARASDAQPFAWSQAAREHARPLQIDVPESLKPRSLTPGAPIPKASLERAETLAMSRYGAGLFGPGDCDAFGRVSPAQIMGRFADGSAHEIAELRAVLGAEVGVAVVEHRLAYLDWPVAGDRFDIRSGLKRAEPRRLLFEDWILDPASGRPWAIAEVVLLPFDLAARKALSLSDKALAALKARIVSL
jgi:acyl-CoA thioester hydrolase